MGRAIGRAAAPGSTGKVRGIEWPTLALIGACYLLWLLAGIAYAAAPLLCLPLMALSIVLHSSLQHEAIHRHPTLRAGWNEALVWPPLGLLVPYRRFREQHLRHHRDSSLTDPYDDPESFYLADTDWRRLPASARTLLALNNVLVVRMIAGPVITTVTYLWAEAKAFLAPVHRRVRVAWAHHAAGFGVVALIAHALFTMPLGGYLLAVYCARALLAVRSFAEHQWAEQPGARTVIVERSWLGLLFLNNNLHVVHHARPGLSWYALPAAYRARREEWQASNGGYVFRGYRAVLRQFALRAKEPVRHPAGARR